MIGSRRGSWMLFAGLLLLVPGCGDSPVEPEEILELPRDLTLSEIDLLTASNGFAFELLDQVYGVEERDFVFLSPLSVSMALGMTMNGADGSTWEGMRSTLDFSGMTQEEINESYQSLIELLDELDPEVRFGLGNSLWYREGWELEQDFITVLQSYFDAEVSALDFSDPSAADQMNAWVRQKTDGMIEDIVEPPIDMNTLAFLINAIYFDGRWTYRFDSSDSRPGTFTHGDGSTESVTLMEMKQEFPYTETDDYQAVDLPYGGQAYSMTVLLPKEEDGLAALVNGLDLDEWEGIVNRFSVKEVELELPRFELEYDLTLNDALSALGMDEAFDPARADFSRMYQYALESGLHIKEVKHKTFVEVDEAGTRAAGVTSVEMTLTALPETVQMEVDHPFVFAIRERLSGTILFIGAVGSFLD